MRSHEPPGTRLEGWKAIARYLGKDPRTALRWVDLGLPVCRVNGRNSSVYAYSDEVEAWLRGRPPGDDEPGAQVVTPLRPVLALAPRRARGAGADLAAMLCAAADQVTELDPEGPELARALVAGLRSFLDALHTLRPANADERRAAVATRFHEPALHASRAARAGLRPTAAV